MTDEEWRGFATAYAEAVRPEDPRGLTGRRMLVVGISTVMAVALGALIYGALGGPAIALPSELHAVTPGASTVPYQAGNKATGQIWTAIAGPSCTAGVDGTTRFSVYDYYTGAGSNQTTGWSTSASGGYSGEACSGGYISMPVSGKADSYDTNRFALWDFDFSAKFTDASCEVATYVPKNPSPVYVGGQPAYYYYSSGYTVGSTVQTALGGYLVKQVDKQGQWVSAPAFNVTTGKVTVKLVDAGALSSSAADAHAAIAQVRLTCTST